MSTEEYWCREMHNVDKIGFDTKRSLRLYRQREKRGVWVIDSECRPGNEDYLMRRHLRL